MKKHILNYLRNQQLISDTIYIEKIYEEENQAAIDDIETERNDNETNRDEYIQDAVEQVEMTNLDNKWKSSETMDALYENIHKCQQCELGKSRKKFVFGSGNNRADIMVIGEAPGKDEDEQGLPFVGRAGQLLTKIIESIDLKREDVYIANICKCRPPNNRAPLQKEVDACIPFLLKQIELIKPAFILALGATAAASLTGDKPVMAQARGQLTEFHGVPMLITYHPAALLYNPNLKRAVWEDMKLLKKLYNDFLEKNKTTEEK